MDGVTVTTGWTSERVRRSFVAVALAASAVLAACGGESPAGLGPPPVTTPAGSYTIQTVNGKALPVALYADGSYTWEVTVGIVTLGADGTYARVTTYRQTVPGNVELFVDSTGGTWSQSGSAIQLTVPTGAPAATATWDKGLFTYAESDGTNMNTFVYLQKK
jgi:hypothetical protein